MKKLIKNFTCVTIFKFEVFFAADIAIGEKTSGKAYITQLVMLELL